MLCLKKRRTYSFTQGVCGDLPRRTKKDHRPLRDYGESLDMAITTLPRKNGSREERPSRMVLTVTEDTPADMLAGSMELLVQLPRDNHIETQRVTVQRSTPMMDLLVQIATAHKLAASSYTLQAIGERGLVLTHQPNTPIGALDALQVKLLPKQGTFVPRKTKQANQPFETTFRLQVHLPRNQLYVSRVSPKMNLGEILDEVCREKNLDRNKYELRHPVNLEEVLDLSLSLQDYHLQEVTLYAKQGRSLGSVLCTQDIMALQRQEERRRQQAKQGVFGFMFKKSKEGSLSTDSLGGRSASPARSDETGRSSSPLQPPARPQRKRRPAPKPPIQIQANEETVNENSKDKIVISHSRNSSDSSGYHEASVLSDNPDSAARLPETLPRRNRVPALMDAPRKLAQTSQSSKSLGNLATASGMLSHGISCASLSSTGLRKKRAAPPPPVTRPLSSAISSQGLERIVDSEESLTSDMDPSKPPSDIGAPSKANSDIDDHPKASSDIGIAIKPIDFTSPSKVLSTEDDTVSMKKMMVDETYHRSGAIDVELDNANLENTVEVIPVEAARVSKRDFSETDILLQKVSDTLSNSLSVSKETPLEPLIFNNSDPVVAKESTNTVKKQETSDYQDTISNQDTSNLTLSSQQDTSDYISAVDEDLSINDWEYHLPAPPTAFRDTNSPAIEGYDTITLDSVEAFKEPILHNVDQPDNSKNINNIIENNRQKVKPVLRKEEKLSLHKEEVSEAVKEEPPKMKIVKEPQKINSQVELKKEIINELENKIGSLPQLIRENDNRKVIDNASTPKIAPIDNTLSNFTITTYSRQKSLNMFEEPEEDSQNSHRDERFMKSFPTLSRNKSNFKNSIDGMEKALAINDLRGDVKELKKLEPKMCEQPIHRWTANDLRNEKSNIQRSKSYLSMNDNKKYNGEVLEKKYDSGIEENLCLDNGLKKATSITNLNGSVPRNNEKFSQWRENILKRQEEPTKEKQLQSLQVLKSILPQLKNTQQADENVSKENINPVLNETGRSETASNENSNEPNVSLSRDSRTQMEPKKLETESKKLTEEKKRYTYSGPPAISLGSWSERPSINVQIKMDTDYKLGSGKHGSGKTIVNIKGTRDEPDSSNYSVSDKNTEESASVHITATKKEDFTKKLTNHTAAYVFKIPSLNNVNTTDIKSTTNCTEKPIVTGVELKKTLVEKEETKKDESIIDTSPMNFKELTKAFGQDVCFRTKPKRLNPNRRSEHFNTQPDNIPKSIETSVKLNGHVNSATNNLTNGIQHETRPKRFTSVVGINPQNQSSGQNFVFRNSINTMRNNQTMPVVKGFKIQGATDAKVNVSHDSKPVEVYKSGPQPPKPPKPPTMPVITGVTLKSASARPKSMPVQIDPRDTLLESIRNFGGHGKLKKAAERC